ncbi:metallopeptidase [Saccharothrix sp. Mg75]|uniref:metallopeptidase n=1 Tax=Saccharothrix sp. Mg75 TaxID=3445357 RepID=UPI003EEAE4A9
MNDELVPLGTGFDVSWRGYRRDQVHRYVDEAEADVRLLTADRDAALRCADLLTARLEAQRHENRLLRARLDRVCRSPLDLDGAEERAWHLVRLAQDEAAEIAARARAVAERAWLVERRAEASRRRRHEALIEQLEAHRRHAETEHRTLLDRARAEVAALTREAERRRRELDDRAARARHRVAEDFELAMSVRRAEALRALARHEAAARAETEHVVREARQRVAVLTGHRDRITTRLRAVAEVLTRTGSALALAPALSPSAPDARTPDVSVPDVPAPGAPIASTG